MRDDRVYHLVFQYVVLQNLYKSLLYDQKGIRHTFLKLRRAYPAVLQDVIARVEAARRRVREDLRRSGCRVLAERPVGKAHYYVMYRHEGVTVECQFEGRVLLAHCERKMQELYAGKPTF